MRDFFDAIMPRIIFGEGAAVKELTRIVKTIEGAKRVLCITDKGVKAAGIVDPVEGALKDCGYEVFEWSEIGQDPSEHTCDTGADFAREKKIDVFVAIGGGAVMDVCKCVALLCAHPGKLLDYQMFVGKPIVGMCKPWIAIPTTAGTGSEATASATISESDTGRKLGVKSIDFMKSYAAIIDPVMTKGLPKALTASTGMDAMSHAVEALTITLANDISDVYAEAAIRKLTEFLPRAVADGSDLEARGKVGLAAAYAAMAFGNSSLHIGHAIAHALGESLHVPHGIACAWGTPFAIRGTCHREDLIPDRRLRILADSLAVYDPSLGRDALADACEKKVMDMMSDFDMPVPSTFKGGSIAGKECMEAAVKACVELEQPMLGQSGAAPQPDLIRSWFEEMWDWSW